MSKDPTLTESMTCVKDLTPGVSILQYFEVRSRDLRKTRSGQDYLDLGLGDATGTIPAKMWSDSIRKWGNDFLPGAFVKVEGRIELYRERNQLVVEKIRLADVSEIPDIGRLVRSSQEDPDSLFEELLGTARGLRPADLAALVEAVLTENAESFKTFPAARMIHHAYKGGLIEHTAAVTRKVEAILRLEPDIDRDIAVAGAILHDMGKTVELSPATRGRTIEGRLIGHVILGRDMIRDAAMEAGIEAAEWLHELEHIVLSHHGETEFGAPVRPATREALLVHFVDNLDSKLKIMSEALESVDSEGFTPYNKWLEGRVFEGTHLRKEEEENDRDSREAG